MARINLNFDDLYYALTGKYYSNDIYDANNDGNARFKLNVSTDASVAKDFGGSDDVVLVSASNIGQVRLTFTSADDGNGNPLDGNNAVNEDGGLAVRLQLENADGTLAADGSVSRFEDEGINFVSNKRGLTFDVRDLPTGTQRGDQFEVVRLGTQAGDRLSASDPSRPYYINAGGGDDNVTGGKANDFLVGGAGNDILAGGMGNDTLIGGAGNDTFVIDAGRYSGMSSGSRASAGIDTILDFSPADDTIQLGKEIFRNLTQGFLNPDAFSSSGAATLASHRIIYDQTTGGLSYDADGSGLGGSVAFATLMTKPANVTAADFLVI